MTEQMTPEKLRELATLHWCTGWRGDVIVAAASAWEADIDRLETQIGEYQNAYLKQLDIEKKLRARSEALEKKSLSERIHSFAPEEDSRDEVFVQLCTLRKWTGETAALEARIEALEKEPNEWQAATRHLLEHYPEDVFPPNSNTPDAKAGTFARRLLTWLLDPAERARLAALAKEKP